MLDMLKTDSSIKEETDSLGGSYLLDSGVYDMIVDMAYIEVSKNGAVGLVLQFKGAGNESLKQTLWMTNRDKLNYYVDNKGDKQYLPGFSQANALALLTLNKEISEVEPEPKTIKVYNYELKKEAPTEKQVITEMLGKAIKIGVFKQIVDKTAKNAAGVYEPTGETREENEIGKLFHAESGLTVAEARNGETVGSFVTEWEAKHKGTVRNKAKGASKSGAPGAPKAGGGDKPKKSLFGNAA
jgi:hypothetical protein